MPDNKLPNNDHLEIPLRIPKPKKLTTIKKIAFFGSADVDPEHPLYKEAFKAARHLVYQGKIIVNGGGPGVMDASTQGAKSAGGETIGVTFYPKDMPEFEGRYYKNVVDKEIKTANYIERMFGLIDEADAFVCFRGGTGTLSEWATAWLLSHLHFGNHKPIVLYGDFWRDLMDVVEDRFMVSEKEKSIYKIVTGEKEMIEVLDQFEKELRARVSDDINSSEIKK
jgi:uncharacterized protein (TIGR00730 family)